MIYINGHDLTIEQVIAVSRQGETVAIAPEAAEKIRAARAYVDRKLADKAVVYGLTTGFGKFSTVFVPEEETAQLQRNLIISHACGMGEPLDTRVVRAAMLLRLNALARGNSGIRLSTMETLLQMLNRGVHPIIPEKGSLGASGDLAPLSHMVLVMLGEGEAEYQGRVMPGREAMAAAGMNAGAQDAIIAVAVVAMMLAATLILLSEKELARRWGVRILDAGGLVEKTPEELRRDERAVELAEHARLTPRETEILSLVAQGKNGPAIMQELFIAEGTFKAHMSHIYEKCGVANRRELVVLLSAK